MIGLDAKTYYGAAGSSASTELTIVREVTTDIAADDVVSGYRDSGWKSHEAGQKDGTVNLIVKNSTANAGFLALQAAFENRTPIALKILDVTSGKGIDADFAVLAKSRPEPIDGVIECTFTLAINTDTRAPVWV